MIKKRTIGLIVLVMVLCGLVAGMSGCLQPEPQYAEINCPDVTIYAKAPTPPKDWGTVTEDYEKTVVIINTGNKYAIGDVKIEDNSPGSDVSVRVGDVIGTAEQFGLAPGESYLVTFTAMVKGYRAEYQDLNPKGSYHTTIICTCYECSSSKNNIYATADLKIVVE